MALETVSGQTVFNGGRDGIPCCRRAVAESTPTKISRHIWYMEKLRVEEWMHVSKSNRISVESAKPVPAVHACW